MTKRTTDEHSEYNVTDQSRNSVESPELSVIPAVPAHGHYIAITHREYYIWQRLGGSAVVRHLIAPEGLCAQCEEERADSGSYRGWFCYSCQRTLANLSQLPTKRTL